MKTLGHVSDLFDIILQKHARIIKHIDMSQKLENCFDDSNTKNEHVYVIKIEILDTNSGKKT